jgi:hypothetical protein
MNNHRHHNRSRRCLHCGQPFQVNPRLGRRHRFCAQPACSKASRRASRKKWLKKNGGRRYFSGKENGDRVRSWRQRHPRYWQRGSARKPAKGLKSRLTKKLASVMRCVALQDSIDARLALEIGLISAISGAALQDTIATEMRRLIMRGYAILRGRSPK